MKKIKKMIAVMLAAVMLTAYVPITECYAAGSTEYTSAVEMEFNKLYLLTLVAGDAYTGEHSYTWYKFTPKTSAETKVEILNTTLTGNGIKYHIYDSLIQEVKIRDKKLDLEKNVTYYLRMDCWNSPETEISFMLKTSGDAGSDTNNGGNPSISPTTPSNQTPDSTTDTKPSNPAADTKPDNPATDTKPGNPAADTKPGNNTDNTDNNTGNDSSNDFDGVDSDFWDDSNNGSNVYDDELPVPEITEVENGSRSVMISWSCEDTDNIDGYYIYRSKDGKNWNKIAAITDTEIEDYEDKDIVDGDACGYIVCSYSGKNKSENSVPEYTCYLKKISIRSAKSSASKKLKVTWTTNPKCSGYQIRVSTTKSFTKTTTISKNADSASCSSKTISKLKGGKKYYVQVRAYRTYNGEVYYSEWSAVKSVKVKR